MKIYEIRVDHEPRETRNLNIGIGLMQVVETALMRVATTAASDPKQQAIFRSIARQFAAARAGSE